MQTHKRLLWIIGIIVIGFIIVAWLVLGPASSPPPTHPETETVGPGTVVIDNTDELSSILLSEEYTATINQLVAYIQTEIGSGVTHAVVEGRPAVQDNGLVVFSIKTENPEKKFRVEIDRFTSRSQVIFRIPGSGFTRTLQAY
ncbi:MAG: hypothetical protein WD887_00160 [Candidatus Saccharimonadales bacterium]